MMKNDDPSNYPQWSNPEEPKRPGFVKRHPVTTVFLILTALVLGVVVGCAALIGGAANEVAKESKTHVPSTTTPVAPGKPAPKKAAPKAEPNEANDVTRFELVDKSQNFGGSAWVDDVEIAYTITNHSSKSSNYVVEWEVTNDAGTRIANSSEFVTTLAPGQTTKGTDVLVPITHQQYVDGTNLKITNVDRTYDWS